MPFIKFSQKSILEHIILALVNARSYSADELFDKFRQHNLEIPPGSLYPILAQLKRNGCTQSQIEETDSGPAQKCFSITEKGQVRLKELKSSWRSIERLLYKITH